MKKGTFRGDPQLKRFPLVASVLDFLATLPLPWSHPLFVWIAFLSSPVWFGIVAAVVFIAFAIDICFGGNPSGEPPA